MFPDMGDEPWQVERMQAKSCSHYAAHGGAYNGVRQSFVHAIGKAQQDTACRHRYERTRIFVEAPGSLRDAVGTVFDRGTLEALALTGKGENGQGRLPRNHGEESLERTRNGERLSRQPEKHRVFYTGKVVGRNVTVHRHLSCQRPIAVSAASSMPKRPSQAISAEMVPMPSSGRRSWLCDRSMGSARPL